MTEDEFIALCVLVASAFLLFMALTGTGRQDHPANPQPTCKELLYATR